jgi:hypothetical protein
MTKLENKVDQSQKNNTSKSCKSSWKLNGIVYHGCSNDAVEGICLCAVEVDPATKELTHWRPCWLDECSPDSDVD